jgi:hypothetical protein
VGRPAGSQVVRRSSRCKEGHGHTDLGRLASGPSSSSGNALGAAPRAKGAPRRTVTMLPLR